MRLVFLEQCTQILSEENDGTPLSLGRCHAGNRERPVARAYYLGQILPSPQTFSHAAVTRRYSTRGSDDIPLERTAFYGLKAKDGLSRCLDF